MNKPYYVTLTGSKNNAGDFLIKDRAFSLFKNLRPDREIIDYSGWVPLSDDQLEVVNNSELLILLGDPSVRPNMYPDIFPLRENLDDIKVPIILFGAGWKSPRRDWYATREYKFSSKSLELLKRISDSGVGSSVRDYHTLNCLHHAGFDNFVMTGCPAYFDQNFIGKDIDPVRKIKNIAFSLGVSFLKSAAMEKLMKEQILQLRNFFPSSNLTVVFHHSLSPDISKKGLGIDDKHSRGHREFSLWLKNKDVDFIDISGSADSLKDFYSSQDFHVGYRVHAHIYMQSISKLSCLFSEDGRGAGVAGVIGGFVYDPIIKIKKDFISKVMKKISSDFDDHIPDFDLLDEVKSIVTHELNHLDYKLLSVRSNIDILFKRMEVFIKNMP